MKRLALIVLILGLTGPARADITDNLRDNMKCTYFNEVTITANTAALDTLRFSPSDTNLVTTPTGFTVKRLRIDYRSGTAVLAITLITPSGPSGTPKNETVLLPAGALLDMVGHEVRGIIISSGPTVGNPLYLIGEN